MLNFDDGFDRHGDGDTTCKQASRKFSTVDKMIADIP